MEYYLTISGHNSGYLLQPHAREWNADYDPGIPEGLRSFSTTCTNQHTHPHPRIRSSSLAQPVNTYLVGQVSSLRNIGKEHQIDSGSFKPYYLAHNKMELEVEVGARSPEWSVFESFEVLERRSHSFVKNN